MVQPNRPLLRKMDLESKVMSSDPDTVKSALELTQFFVKFYRKLDYNDFSDNPFCVNRIRRFIEFS